MKKLIHEVIELDKQAQNEISLLKKEKEELFLAIKEMRTELTTQHKKAINNEIAQIEKDAKELFDKRIAEIEAKAKNKETKIQAYYDEHKAEWIADLLAFISNSKE